jgi:hypothetical protein
VFNLTAATIAFLTILTFWNSTVTAELFGSQRQIATLKHAIPWGFLLLVPALATTAATGYSMAGSSSSAGVRAKKRQMPFIAGDGLLVLAPTALYLDSLATRPSFGAAFYSVQALELLTGALNLTLMSLNIRDGINLARCRATP